jgi:hypothetical protein
MDPAATKVLFLWLIESLGQYISFVLKEVRPQERYLVASFQIVVT